VAVRGFDHEATALLPPSLASAREARSFVRGTASDVLGEEGLATAELLTSEVVTNALLHGRDAPRLVVACRGHTVRVSVEDADPRWPTRQSVAETELRGRGIALVDALAAAWGVERLDQVGKRVWFEVREGQEWPTGFALHWDG
jgi:anti-sigma regulatory factor (Ser/Thr protein kinase)